MTSRSSTSQMMVVPSAPVVASFSPSGSKIDAEHEVGVSGSAGERAEGLSRVCVPQADHLVLADAGEHVVAGRERDVPDPALMGREPGEGRRPWRHPRPDGAVLCWLWLRGSRPARSRCPAPRPRGRRATSGLLPRPPVPDRAAAVSARAGDPCPVGRVVDVVDIALVAVVGALVDRVRRDGLAEVSLIGGPVGPPRGTGPRRDLPRRCSRRGARVRGCSPRSQGMTPPASSPETTRSPSGSTATA